MKSQLLGALTVSLTLSCLVFGVNMSGEQGSGTVTGVVKTQNIPDVVSVAVDTDQVVCGREVEDQTTLVNSSGGVANAVIVVAGAAWTVDPPMPSINNRACYFEPRVQVAKTRSVATVTSEDETLHTTHAYDDRARTMFNIALPVPGLSIERPLRRPGVVRVECDSHAWMRGWVYVTDDIAAVSHSDGRFEISDIPPGTYELMIWHERFSGAPQTVTVEGGGTTQVDFLLQ